MGKHWWPSGSRANLQPRKQAARGSQDKLLKSDKRRRDQESSGWKPRFQDYSHSLQKSRMNHGWHILGYLYFNPCSANLLVVVFTEVARPVQASEPFPVKRFSDLLFLCQVLFVWITQHDSDKIWLLQNQYYCETGSTCSPELLSMTLINCKIHKKRHQHKCGTQENWPCLSCHQMS